MRGLIFKASYFYSKDKLRSTWPEAISEYGSFDKAAETGRNIIVIWVCIESNDKEEYLRSLTKRVKELNKQFYKLKHIILFPFAHLSNKLANPKKGREFISKLSILLGKEGFQVDTISFGTHKDIKLEVPGQPAAVSYFEFPYSGKKPKVN